MHEHMQCNNKHMRNEQVWYLRLGSPEARHQRAESNNKFLQSSFAVLDHYCHNYDYYDDNDNDNDNNDADEDDTTIMMMMIIRLCCQLRKR